MTDKLMIGTVGGTELEIEGHVGTTWVSGRLVRVTDPLSGEVLDQWHTAAVGQHVHVPREQIRVVAIAAEQ